MSFSSLHSRDLFSYTFKVWIKQRSASFLNVNISSSGGALPCSRLLAILRYMSTVLSLSLSLSLSSKRDMQSISSWCILEALEAGVSANTTVRFRIRFLLERNLFCFKLFFINSRAIWTSQMDEYLSWGGLRLKTPVNRVQTSGCCSTGKPSIFS